MYVANKLETLDCKMVLKFAHELPVGALLYRASQKKGGS